MVFNPAKHHRRSIRLKGYDYTESGAYFVTLCTLQKECLLGDIKNEKIILNQIGELVENSWEWLSEHHEYIELDNWIIMPNHLHGIIHISQTDNISNNDNVANVGAVREPSLQEQPIKIKSLGRLIGTFKTVSTKKINKLLETPGKQFWQRNYYEHIIRDDAELNRIREYIINNPIRWDKDENNPVNYCTNN